MTMVYAHESGCDELHTRRQQCNGAIADAKRRELTAEVKSPGSGTWVEHPSSPRGEPDWPRRLQSHTRYQLRRAILLECIPTIAGIAGVALTFALAALGDGDSSVVVTVFVLAFCSLVIPFLVAGLGWLSLGLGAVAGVATAIRLVSVFVMFAGLGDALIGSSCDAEFASECVDWWETDGFPIFVGMGIVNFVAPLASAVFIALVGFSGSLPGAASLEPLQAAKEETLAVSRRRLAIVLECLPVIVGLAVAAADASYGESGSPVGLLYLVFLASGLGWLVTRRVAIGLLTFIVRLPFALAALAYLPVGTECGIECAEDLSAPIWAFFGFLAVISLMLPAASAVLLYRSTSAVDVAGSIAGGSLD